MPRKGYGCLVGGEIQDALGSGAVVVGDEVTARVDERCTSGDLGE